MIMMMIMIMIIIIIKHYPVLPWLYVPGYWLKKKKP